MTVKVTLIAGLLALLLISAISPASVDAAAVATMEEIGRSNGFLMISSYVAEGKPLQETREGNLETCLSKCSAFNDPNGKCRAFFFRQKDGLCQLHSHLSGTASSDDSDNDLHIGLQYPRAGTGFFYHPKHYIRNTVVSMNQIVSTGIQYQRHCWAYCQHIRDAGVADCVGMQFDAKSQWCTLFAAKGTTDLQLFDKIEAAGSKDDLYTVLEKPGLLQKFEEFVGSDSSQAMYI
eukprot:Nk52_evm14s1967 gene=Nk52_evmTU14s1967